MLDVIHNFGKFARKDTLICCYDKIIYFQEIHFTVAAKLSLLIQILMAK